MTVAQPQWPFQQPRPEGLALYCLGLDDYPLPDAPALAHEQWLEQALPSRRREFAAGRVCAAAALQALGHEPAWLPLARPYRYARFPLGVVGSISHTQDLALACAADAQHFLGVGVDAERIAWHPELCPMTEHVMAASERVALEGMTAVEQLRFFYLSFSAKEAFFKAVFPICHTDLEFAEAQLEHWDAQGHFRLRLTTARLAPWFAQGQLFEGCWAVQGDTLLTLLTIGHDLACCDAAAGQGTG
ncbi:4'-phosphopantetheinyl transferase family protein [Pseudomonas sp. UFMG81]|jgi:enterobactin synthetase component D|uniref:4'-phosphopantetheinyl transferase family protein n=1 Tax=Pseudomonas sp. UFMG81 TaxID=2745936 RepID=UPI00188E7A3B|nr:4'-phosphopantetheinyl transferase superfamily protein [Pseudomonas sp. UFMG81]